MLVNEKLALILIIFLAFILLFAGTKLYNISLKDIFNTVSVEIVSPFYDFSLTFKEQNIDNFDSQKLYEIEQKLKLVNSSENEVYNIISRISLQNELAKFFNKRLSTVYAKNSWELTYCELKDLKFKMPIDNGLLVYNEYYYPGALRRYRNGIHQGIDLSITKDWIKLPRGSPIYSISKGIVVKITNYEYYSYQRNYFQFLAICKNQRHTDDRYLDLFRGKQVQIKYKNLLIIYCHLDSFNDKLKIGSKVSKGTLIGYMGNSGVEYMGSSPHLHLEVYLNNFIIGVNRERTPFDYEYKLFSTLFNQ